jgi:hypothetical protein
MTTMGASAKRRKTQAAKRRKTQAVTKRKNVDASQYFEPK